MGRKRSQDGDKGFVRDPLLTRAGEAHANASSTPPPHRLPRKFMIDVASCIGSIPATRIAPATRRVVAAPECAYTANPLTSVPPSVTTAASAATLLPPDPLEFSTTRLLVRPTRSTTLPMASPPPLPLSNSTAPPLIFPPLYSDWPGAFSYRESPATPAATAVVIAPDRGVISREVQPSSATTRGRRTATPAGGFGGVPHLVTRPQRRSPPVETPTLQYATRGEQWMSGGVRPPCDNPGHTSWPREGLLPWEEKRGFGYDELERLLIVDNCDPDHAIGSNMCSDDSAFSAVSADFEKFASRQVRGEEKDWRCYYS